MLGKIKCLLGWYSWVWKFDGKPISLGSNPPDHAKCEKCGVTYGRN